MKERDIIEMFPDASKENRIRKRIEHQAPPRLKLRGGVFVAVITTAMFILSMFLIALFTYLARTYNWN